MKKLICLFFLSACAYADSTYYWVQALASHPQHVITRAAFKQRCQELKMSCDTIGTDDNNLKETIDLAIKAVEGGNVAGLSIWVGGAEWQPLIDRALELDVPVVIAHSPLSSPQIKGIVAAIGGDPRDGGARFIDLVAEKLHGKKGSFAITQGSFNDFEDVVAKTFAEELQKRCPDLTLLKPVLEGFDPEKAPSVATSIFKENPDLLGAFSTTALGARTWALAQRELNKKIVVVGGNQLGENLSYVQSGEILAVGWSPFIEISQAAAEILYKAQHGKAFPYHNTFPREIVTQQNVDSYIARKKTLMEKVASEEKPQK